MKQKKWRGKLLMLVLGLLVLTGLFNLTAPVTVLAGEPVALTVTGDGVATNLELTLPQLQAMEQYQQVYSAINTWPTKKWYTGEGVKLRDLLDSAGMKEEATLIKFTSQDSFTVTLTVREVVYDDRYYYPGLTDNHEFFGQVPGSSDGAVEVEPILALESVEGSDNPSWMNDSNALLLMLGQRAVTEQNGQLFVKKVEKIEVLTTEPGKWDEPEAEPGGGGVAPGTLVKLSSVNNDDDKVYYTTDGSTPDLNSPMYNWISSRWWSSRADELDSINHPIEITKDTVIKAITIGPGKKNSDIVTFTYQVPAPPALTADVTDNIVGQPVELTFTEDVTWRAAITGLDVDGVALNAEDYSKDTAGVIAINGEVFNIAGDYAIVIKAAGYADACVTQTIGTGLNTPPALTADATDNIAGQPVELTFTQDVAWQAAITGLSVDGTPLAVNDYIVEEAKLTIKAGVFKQAGNYAIAVQATGYADACVTQVIKAAGNGGTVGPEEDVVLTITGNGVTTEKTFTLAQLQAMDQYEHVYSAINTWPTKKWYVGKGVKLSDLLNEAGVKSSAKQIKFNASDSFTATLTVQELLKDRRYYFPGLKDNDEDLGQVPGSSAGKQEVEPILALESAEGSKNFDYMNDINALLLMLGQRAVTEQNGQLFVKKIEKIEVSTEAPEEWDEPEVEPGSGEVAPGTLVKLSSAENDVDKVYYTTDGSSPTLDSPMYNWIASRWWASRADDVDSVNHPLEITKDTTIKAKVIGPGRRDSNVVTFTYKVKEDPIKSSTISREGGIVEYEEEGGSKAVIEIPSGALKNANAEVAIQKVTVPPAVPSGFKLLGSVYEFLVDEEKSYSFAKEVTIKLSFDPGAVGEGETPAISYYDEELEKWVNLGGEISGNTITIQVDHFTKFAVMVAGEPEVATGLITPGEGGTVSLVNEAAIEIPSGSLNGTGAVEVKIEKVTTPPTAPAGFKFAGSVYEFSVDGKSNYSFAKSVIISLSFEPGTTSEGETLAIYCYDEELEQWVNLGGEVSSNTITVQVDHFTKFAVMIAVQEPVLTDIAGHWAFDNINKLLAMECISGYPDGTFRPDNPITRAEFITVLVKAFEFKLKDGKSFADTAEHWSEEYIATATAGGIVNGYDDDTFGPDDHITREQMAVMTAKAAKINSVAGEPAFADSGSISGWASAAVNTATVNGIMKGYPDNNFRPQGSATRAEAVTVIINALKVSPHMVGGANAG
ncbi:MAG: S-layer homology domain-containing protein [Desulfotomaculaceae bacterium]|nr:S-layer homology domain-containing protein [Desulfotomaculaceae bacterium]